jgi:peptidyl-tRNA hydrolase, PTH1 family
MKVIVGLGNIGAQYIHTRHNLGFTVVEQVLKDCASVEETRWEKHEKLKSEIAFLTLVRKDGKQEKILLAKPLTYMNNSGFAVSLLMSFYKITAEDVWLVYDELDLPLGVVKIRFGGADAGHHGVESVMEHLGTDQFWRFRLGIGISHPQSGREVREDGKQHPIGRQKIKGAEEYVLGTFSSSEQGKVRDVIRHGSDALQLAVTKGIEVSMNRYNTK